MPTEDQILASLALPQEPDPDLLEQLGQRIDGAWSALQPATYLDLVQRLVERASGTEFGDIARQHRFIADQILTALGRTTGASVVERGALLRLMPIPSDIRPALTQFWLIRRDEAARRWLEVWKQANELIDPDFDSAERPTLNVAPPQGRVRRPGTVPSEITEDEDRKAYEQRIAENADRSSRYATQLRIRETRSFLERALPVFLSSAYGFGPDATPSLQKLLTDGEVPATLSNAVLEDTARRRAQTGS